MIYRLYIEMIIIKLILAIIAPVSGGRDLFIGLFGAIIGAIVSFILSLLFYCIQNRFRRRQYAKEVDLLTTAILKHSNECYNAINTYCGNINQNPHQVQVLQQGILSSIKRIQRLDATVVYEAFEYKKKSDVFYSYLNLIDQLYQLYESVYYDYEKHNDNIVQMSNELIDIQGKIIYGIQSAPNTEDTQNVMEQYSEVCKSCGKNSVIDIKIINDKLISPLHEIVNKDLSIKPLFMYIDKAEYLYRTICQHQINFSNHLCENVLPQINKTLKQIKKLTI